MLFTRSVPKRRYRDYTRYRDLLRRDFQYRCAYCLIHEFHNGGAANFAIDHHRPMRGVYARPDLAGDYANLYWCCSECNQNKADRWPAPQQEALGFRWIDPCELWGDHDLHWQITYDGEISGLLLRESTHSHVDAAQARRFESPLEQIAEDCNAARPFNGGAYARAVVLGADGNHPAANRRVKRLFRAARI